MRSWCYDKNMITDIVLPWVDGNDPKWRSIKQSYSDSGDAREERYRDFGLMRYWFRGIEVCMPWVRRIHFITMDQVPEWLDTSHPKLNLVDHKDYIPHDCLPTFNSNVIELNVHRINELSEQFVLFNDDCFVVKPIPETFFFRDGKPVDMLALQPVVANESNEVMSYIYLNNAILIARHFKKLENMKKQPKAYFNPAYPLRYQIYNRLEQLWPRYTGFFTAHGPSPLLKSTLQELWELEPAALEQTSHNRFRDKTDVSQYLVREYEKQKGNFISENILKDFSYFDLDNDNVKLMKCLDKREVSMICINDSNQKIEFERVREELIQAFEKLFPDKSSFEL